jgi:hypothetical protein
VYEVGRKEKTENCDIAELCGCVQQVYWIKAFHFKKLIIEK